MVNRERRRRPASKASRPACLCLECAYPDLWVFLYSYQICVTDFQRPLCQGYQSRCHPASKPADLATMYSLDYPVPVREPRCCSVTTAEASVSWRGCREICEGASEDDPKTRHIPTRRE